MTAEGDPSGGNDLVDNQPLGAPSKPDGRLVKRRLHWLPNLAKVLYFLAAVLMLAAQVAVPARAQEPVETLVSQIFGTKDAAAYELQAHVRGMFSLTAGGGFIAGTAAGIFREWRTPGSRRWSVTVQELELPWLLRPFSGAVRSSIEQRVEAQSEAFESFQNYDVFISEELAGGQYVLVGLRRDLVDEAITRFGRSVDKQDVASRRAIARWLFTAPSMRSWITRPGQPYVLKVVTDESGLVHELQVSYERSQVGMKFSYLTVSDQAAWKEVLSTFVNSNAKGLGRLEGQLRLGFADYKVDLTPRWQDIDRAEKDNRAQQSDESNQSDHSDPTQPSVP
ncbi:MAG TPA: hypothetical protein VK201_10075 [bacterium]|nr:hypothetical protein [bacterium]